jgi:hypothetical protein
MPCGTCGDGLCAAHTPDCGRFACDPTQPPVCISSSGCDVVACTLNSECPMAAYPICDATSPSNCGTGSVFTNCCFAVCPE